MVDYVTTVSLAVTVAAVIIMASLLSRYAKLVREADRSTRLAKDVWDSMNSRFSVADSRIIELMAKTEVLSSKVGLSPAKVPPQVSSLPSLTEMGLPAQQTKAASAPVTGTMVEGTDTELKVLRLLASGPKTSAQIKEEVGRSREHTARLMKGLYDRGLVVRNDRNKPYVYEITDSGRSHVAS